MRSLGLQDVFAFSEIIDLMEIEKGVDLNSLMDEAKTTDDPQAFLGGKMMLLFAKNLYKAKKPIYEWLADLTASSVEEVKKLGFKDLTNLFTEIFSDADILDFMNSLAIKEKI